MSQKFSILVVIEKGKPVAKAYLRSDAVSASSDFTKAREEGKEAYLFAKPYADKRSKASDAKPSSKSKLKDLDE